MGEVKKRIKSENGSIREMGVLNCLDTEWKFQFKVRHKICNILGDM